MLVQIDPRDYEVAVERAQADLADAQANADRGHDGRAFARRRNERRRQHRVGRRGGGRGRRQGADQQFESRARQPARRAGSSGGKGGGRDQGGARRRTVPPLVQKDEIPQQQFDAAVPQADFRACGRRRGQVGRHRRQGGGRRRRAARARRRGERRPRRARPATAQTAPQQLQVTQARAAAAEARVKQAEAALAAGGAESRYTTVKAPTDGVVSRKTVEVGQIVQAGQPLLALVDPRGRLGHRQLQGNAAEVDAARPEGDGRSGRARRQASSTATSTASRPQQAPSSACCRRKTRPGNYVKVVQRVPVKIVLEPGQDPDHQLRPACR